jgi:hypothetical protein
MDGKPTKRPKSTSDLGDDQAPSDWETVARIEESVEHQQAGPKKLGWEGNFDLVFHAQEILDPTRTRGPLERRRHTTLGPPYGPPDKAPPKGSLVLCTDSESFPSSSSLYSTPAAESWYPLRSNSYRQPATMGFGQSAREELWAERRVSKASSSTGGDPFTYDSGVYSTFLQRAAEREPRRAPHRAGTSYGLNVHFARQILSGRVPDSGRSFYNPAAIRST